MESEGPSGPSTAGWNSVVVSAGASERFHGAPKALLPVGDEAAIVRLVRVSWETGARRVIVILGARAETIERALDGTGAEVEVNHRWAEGRTGSVQVGLQASGPESDLLLWPVDHPFVASATVARLHAAAERDGLAVWLIPSFRGEGGHPVWIRSPAQAPVLALRRSAPLRSVLAGLGPQVRRVEVDDPGVLENVDSPDAYWSAVAAWRGRGGDGRGP